MPLPLNKKKLDKNLKMWYYTNKSFNIRNLFKKFWQYDLEFTHSRTL